MEGSLTVSDQIQNKANTASFRLNPGVYTAPSENQEVKFFDTVKIVTALPVSTLWGCWHMDEGSGSTLFDASGNGRDATITGAAFTTGERGYGLDIDGATDRVDFSGIASLPTAAITVSVWVKHTSYVDSDRIIWNDYSFGGTGTWAIYSDIYGNWVWAIEAGGAVQKLVTGSHNFDTDGWHHLCGTYDGTTQRFYIDGVSVGTPLTHATTLAHGGTYFRMSHTPWGSLYAKVDETRIYSTALTAAQVKLLYSMSELSVADELSSGLSILDYGKYRANESFYLDVGGADEERVTTYAVTEGEAGEVNIALTATPKSDHSVDEDAGKIIFGGTLTYVKQSNPKKLTDVEYQITATDYTKIFDKKLINDSWVSVDAQYIVNDALNTTINYNKELDDMDYADNAAVQAEWIESGDGNNPTVDTADFVQGTSSVQFSWTYAAGTATFSATPASSDYSDLTGASSGAPAEGNVSFWYKRTTATGIANIKIRVGSDSSNYTEMTFIPEADTDRHFISLTLSGGTETGTPVWTALDYLAIRITETTSSSIQIDDVRMTADGSFTMYNFESTTVFDDARAGFKKPTVFLDRLMDAVSWYWHIDYERDIHAYDRETNSAPFSITDTSNNFDKSIVDVDTAQLKNRQVVRGGTKDSDSVYTQVVQGDGVVREWILKNLFVNLEIWLNDGSSTDTMEATTTSTTVKATAHGLVDGDYIINTSRSNAVRKITYVDANTFTVEAVTAQASGDVFSRFSTEKTVGIENINDEASYDYMYNYSEKSVRSSEQTVTLTATSWLLFIYNEVIPIRVQVSDPVSITAMKAIMGGDGIFDGAVITDTSLKSSQAAHDRAQAEVDAYSNPIVKVSFQTDYEGLESGQLISITDTNKGIAAEYIIQKVRIQYDDRDFPTFDVDCASSLFGIIEYFQKLSQAIEEQNVDENEVIDQIVDEVATITVGESNSIGATEESSESATITVTPSDTASDRSMTTTPYLWQPDASDSRWNLAQWK